MTIEPTICLPPPQPSELRECTTGDVKNMNMDKAVATRLFRMLAVNEQTISSVKADHASYAKLSLLTQQMGLLQQQAQRVVDKAETKAAKVARIEEVGASPGRTDGASPGRTDCTTLSVSSEYDEGAKRLLSMITVSDSTALAVKSDTSSCARLSILAEQVGLLQEQAQTCIDEADLNRHLLELGVATPGTRLAAGVVYYHYVQSGKEVLSRIADDEWASYEEYLGKYLYDYDLTFRKVEGKGGIDVLTQALGPCHEQAAAVGLFVPRSAVEQDAMYTPVSQVHSRW